MELWRASDVPAPAQSAEDKLRGGDTSINACLIGHSLREEDAVSLAESISMSLPDAEIGSYKFLCELRENEAPE